MVARREHGPIMHADEHVESSSESGILCLLDGGILLAESISCIWGQ